MQRQINRWTDTYTHSRNPTQIEHWSSLPKSTRRIPVWNPSLLQDEFEELSEIERY